MRCDFPAERGPHVRTTNPIESAFLTVGHRTDRMRNCVSRAIFLGVAFKLIEAAEQSRRKIRGADTIEPVLKGIPAKDGIPGAESPPAALAAVRLIIPTQSHTRELTMVLSRLIQVCERIQPNLPYRRRQLEFA